MQAIELDKAHARSVFSWRNGFELLGQPDNPARHPGSRVARPQRLLVPFFAQIVLARMHDHRPPHNGQFAKEGDHLVLEAHVRVAEGVRDQVAEITHVPLLGEGAPVVLLMRVEVRARCHAPLGQVPEFVDVDSVLAVGVEPLDGEGNLDRGVEGLLAEGCDSFDVGVVGVEDADGVPLSRRRLGVVRELTEGYGGGAERPARGCEYFSKHYLLLPQLQLQSCVEFQTGPKDAQFSLFRLKIRHISQNRIDIAPILTIKLEMKGAEIDYNSYARAMRGVLSGPEICLPDMSLNHEYFNAKKGFYWSEGNEHTLVEAIKAHGKDWRRIASEFYRDTKSEVQVQMRACILFRVKDSADINQKQIANIEKRVKNTGNTNGPTQNGDKAALKKSGRK